MQYPYIREGFAAHSNPRMPRLPPRSQWRRRLLMKTPFTLHIPTATSDMAMRYTSTMCTSLIVSFAIFISLCAVAHGGGPLPGSSTNSTATEQISNSASSPEPQLIRTLNRLGLKLLADLDANGNENVFISPVSISSALSLLQLGATMMSESAKEIRALIGSGFSTFTNTSDPDVELLSANSVWTTTSVLDSYKSRVSRVLAAKVCPLPPNASPINEFVSDATRGNIPAILEELPEGDIIAILINAIFFQAPWKIAFDPASSVEADFFGPSGEFGSPVVSQVRMMRLVNEEFRYAEVPLRGMSNKYLQVVELDYGSGDEYAAIFVVPMGTTTLEEAIEPFHNGNVQVWCRWIGSLFRTRLRVMALPRFRVEFGVKSLKESLQRLGLNAPFESTAQNPQLSRLSSDDRAFVSDILHKTTVEVTETGTEASAATAVVLFRSSRPTVVLNRPFLFAIRNVRSGALIFIGKIDAP